MITLERERRRKQSRTGFNQVIRVVSMLILATLVANVLLLALGVGGAFAAYSTITQNLPTPEEVEAASIQNFETTKIYDRTGKNLLYEVIDPHAGDRNWVSLDELSEYTICATVANEDRTFWTNIGIDPSGLGRALWGNLRGNAIQGGSTITQQVIKNSVISPEERLQLSYWRKAKEIILAIELTRRYDKRQILEWYVNTNFYGNLAYGIDAASRVYFDKPASQLTLAEAATLSPIPQFPIMNPFDTPDEARKRQGITLDAMADVGCITAAQAEAAKIEAWHLASPAARYDIQAPHFSLYVRRELEKMYGPELVAGGGLRVYTTLDLDLQNQSQCVTQAYLRILKGEMPDTVIPEAVSQGCAAAQYLPDMPAQFVGTDLHVNNSAVVVIRPSTGEILSMVGSANYWDETIDGKFNVAADGLRQPGSSFKPFTYLTFLAQGGNAGHMFLDVRRAFSQGPGTAPYVPENYDRKYHGPVTMREALARSLNIPAVEAMANVGVDKVVHTAHKMGINTLDKGLQFYGLSLTLGGGEVHLLDMVYAFSVFANNGAMYGTPVPQSEKREGFRELNPVSILRVEDRDGKVLYEYKQPEGQQVVQAPLAYIMTDMMADRQARWPAFGTPNPLELANDRPAAAKTGTTNDYVDNWTMGFTPQMAVGVWMGNTDNTPMTSLPGARGAAFIWHAVLEYGLQDEPIVDFVRPDGIENVAICAVSGLKPNGNCPVTSELMIPGTEPEEECQMHQVFLVNKETGRLATVYTPPELVEHKVYEVYPPEAADWLASLAEDRRPDIPPTEYDTVYGPNLSGAEVAIISPTAYAYVQGIVPIVGNAKGDVAFYRLVFGSGMNPTQWQQIGPDHNNQVDQNLLENWDTTGLADGLYTVQLQVVGGDQNVRQYPIQLTVDKEPPRVDLTYPVEGSEYEAGFDEWVNVNAEVRDNYAVAKVEFYVNGQEQPFATRTVPPFNVNWTLQGVGTYTFKIIVYDAAGNKTEDGPVTVYVVPRAAQPN